MGFRIYRRRRVAPFYFRFHIFPSSTLTRFDTAFTDTSHRSEAAAQPGK
jgi:hypothetical protein